MAAYRKPAWISLSAAVTSILCRRTYRQAPGAGVYFDCEYHCRPGQICRLVVGLPPKGQVTRSLTIQHGEDFNVYYRLHVGRPEFSDRPFREGQEPCTVAFPETRVLVYVKVYDAVCTGGSTLAMID